MEYTTFINKVTALKERAGINTDVSFNEDAEKGSYFANFADGTVITASSTKSSVTVRWGDGHTAAAVL